jgi:hypothetical protein
MTKYTRKEPKYQPETRRTLAFTLLISALPAAPLEPFNCGAIYSIATMMSTKTIATGA